MKIPRTDNTSGRGPYAGPPFAHSRGRSRQRGIVALLTIVIIGAVILLIGVSSAYYTQTEIVLTGQEDRGQEALSFARSCSEEALYRLKLDPSYAGGSVPVGDGGTCTSTVTGSGSSRTIVASGTSGQNTKTVQMTVDLRQNTAGNANAWRIGSWNEVDP